MSEPHKIITDPNAPHDNPRMATSGNYVGRRTEINQTVSAIELQLGDQVSVGHDRMPWSTAIVCKIDADSVHLFRPYGTTAGFRYTGGVICYVGIETFSRPRTKYETFFLYRREDLR